MTATTTTGTAERTALIDLLPALYRIRDEEGDGALRALLSIIDDRIDDIEVDIAQLYDDAFIETCAEWAVPYIGDLLGVRNLQEIETANFSRRAYVANTLAYRRRKGTLGVIEQLTRDVTGWSAKAVEFFELLSTTQYPNHLRSHNRTTVDLRRRDLELTGTAFETTTHTAEVRRIDSGRGRYNILNIGVYLWTLQAYAIEDAQARPFAPGDFRFFFEPVDLSALDRQPPLFNSPEAEKLIEDLATEREVAGPLRRRALYDELEQLRQGDADGVPELDRLRSLLWFDVDPVVQVQFPGEADPVPSDQIVICDLSEDAVGDWRRPPVTISYTTAASGVGTMSSAGAVVAGVDTVFQTYFEPGDSIVAGDQTVEIQAIGTDTTITTVNPFAPALGAGTRFRRSRPADIRVGIDPKLGRLALAAGEAHDEVRVSYAYGFSGDVGAGTYDRRASMEAWVELPATIADRVTWHAGVAQNPDPGPVGGTPIFATFAAAIGAWNAIAAADPDAVGVISVMDNSSYVGSLTGANAVNVGPAQMLVITAAQWPARFDDDGNQIPRQPGRLEPVDLRPHLQGDIEIEGGPTVATADGGRVVLDGLLVEGQVTVEPGELRTLRIAHCTIVPRNGGLVVNTVDADGQRNSDLTVELVRSICGPVQADEGIETVRVDESIVDAAGAQFAVSGAVGEPSPPMTFVRSTVLGEVHSRQIDLGSESIFEGQVVAERTQLGCMRFSFIPRDPDATLDSRTPRRFRCQPDLALAERARQDDLTQVSDLPPETAAAIRSRVRPHFTDIDYGRPGYTQLTPTTAPEISAGAENESEMGVWSFLMNSQRRENLSAALNEYLRFGLEAGPIFVT